MGFYLRKSLKAGPLRFNFSKSGIGVSAGIKGLRIGTGPRGNYIHAGRGGFYYRASLSPKNARTYNHTQQPERYNNNEYIEPAQMHDIESGNVLEMVDSSATSLLEEINEKYKKMRLFPWADVSGIIAFIYSAGNLPFWTTWIIAILAIGGCIYIKYRDDLAKSVILFYDFEPEVEIAYQKLHDCFDELISCARVWHVEAQGNTNDWKHNAGANSLIRRNRIVLSKGQPSYIKTNISVPIIPTGRQTLYFFPERVLVFDKSTVGAVNYDSLNIEIDQSQFIETEGVPIDSKVVGKTWKYVNKKGGPDKRFKDNYEIPIALYESAHFKSKSGLNELIHLSKLNITESFKQAIVNLVEISSQKE
ncbi:MAG: DUF4236 domain-containing protein [Candidatus Gastranaerophilales bacterium]|nr:DUF4236 domain-containing protein [Candidatus Gastranaerophilales bacterium]